MMRRMVWWWRQRLLDTSIAAKWWCRHGKLGGMVAGVARKARGHSSIRREQITLEPLQDVHVNPQRARVRRRLSKECNRLVKQLAQ